MFTPEFRNRLDATVLFTPLGGAEIERVVDKHVDELRAQVASAASPSISPSGPARGSPRNGFDQAFGARPMARLIERSVKKPLSELLLFQDLAAGTTVTVDEVDGAIQLRTGAQ